MTVSVVIAYYRGLPGLAVQLDALARQDYEGSFEVIVSDNEGSTDLQRYLDRYPERERLRVRRVDSWC